MNRNLKHIYTALRGCMVGLVSFALMANSCEKSNLSGELPIEEEVPSTGIVLQNAQIIPVWDAVKGGILPLPGTGYEHGDILILEPEEDGGTRLNFAIQNEDVPSVVLTEDVSERSYKISLRRGEVTKPLGTTRFNYVLRTDIPNIASKNVKGVVHVDGQGIPDVVVSDGYEVTTTDSKGVYYLSSNKKTGYVFISIPRHHEVVASHSNLPQFYKTLQSNPEIIDTRDFELRSVDNDDHVVLSLADMHLAGRNDDVGQFQRGFVHDVNEQVAYFRGQGKKVYGLTLGDQTWETYWYSNAFMLPEYIQQIAAVNAPIFNTMGNHDNDPYFANDWMAENTYRRILGPTYYSFNIGKIHYVVLDNVAYINDGGSSGVVGRRNYAAKVTENQLEWLEKDLSYVDPATPIILATHVQLHQAPEADGALPGYRTANAQQIVDITRRFKEVHVLTGHTHINFRVPRSENFMEHNTAAICATWWWTGRPGYANNQIAPDGSPAGYGIWEMQGNHVRWTYKSIGYDRAYQFRSYDLNQVHITADRYAVAADAAHKALVKRYAGDFGVENLKNEVLINVWGYDPRWSIVVTENGQPLEVERVASIDPLQLISYGMKRLNVNAIPTFDAENTSHMFKVKASAPNTSLEIQVTDRFGQVYRESMSRPKSFSTDMR